MSAASGVARRVQVGMGFLDFLKKKDTPAPSAAPAPVDLDAIGRKIAGDMEQVPQAPRPPTSDSFFAPEPVGKQASSPETVVVPTDDFLADMGPVQAERSPAEDQLDWTKPLEEMSSNAPLESLEEESPSTNAQDLAPHEFMPPPPPQKPAQQAPAFAPPPPLPPIVEKKSAPPTTPASRPSKIELPDFTDEDIETIALPKSRAAKPHEEHIVRHKEPAAPASAFLIDPQGKDAMPPPPAQPAALKHIEPAMFLSSDAYFVIADDIKAVRKSLRESDAVLRSAQVRHEHADEQLIKFAAEINAIQERCMALDGALFEE